MPGFFVVDFYARLANTPDSEIRNELDANPKGASFIEEVQTEKEELRKRLKEELERKKAESEVRRAIVEKERRERESRQQEAPHTSKYYKRRNLGIRGIASFYTGEENSDKRS